ncbi:MAG TPA: nitroreductase family protein [Polyangia bacterium]|nr:nitroreductase family protein [Polyangia bacterium]
MASSPFHFAPEELRRLVEAGGMAPSGGNVQPWRVLAYPDALEVGFDLPRATSFLDVGRLASALAVGAFVENVTIASESFGLGHELALGKGMDESAPLARLTFSGRRDPATVWAHPLYPFIPQRVTNRRLHEGPPLDARTIAMLTDAAQDREGRCRCVAIGEEAGRREMARILGATDALRMFHPELHQQMFAELRWSVEEAQTTCDGIDVATLELPQEAIMFLGALRSYDVLARTVPREAISSLTEQTILGSSHMGCLTIATPPEEVPTRQALFAAGQALERLWLTATRLGVALQPWSVLPFLALRVRHFGAAGFEVDEAAEIGSLIQEMAQALDLSTRETPIFIFRLAHAPAPSARSLRLPWTHYTARQPA